MRRIRRYIAALPFALLSGLTTSPAGAQVVRAASLSVESPDAADCPDANALRATIEAHLGRPGFVADAPRQIVVRFLPRRGARRAAQIVVREPGAAPATREFSQPGPACTRLADAVALAVELVVDPDAALRPRVTPAPVCPEVACPACETCPAPTPPPPPPEPVVRIVTREAPALPVWAALTGGGTFGFVPSGGWLAGFQLRAALTPRWSVELGVDFTPAVNIADPLNASSQIASLGRTVARAGGCFDALATSFRLGFCGGAMAGAEHLAALSLQPLGSGVGDHPWLGLWVGAHAVLPVGSRLFFGADGRFVVSLLSSEVGVEGRPSPVYQPSPVGFEGQISFGVRLR